MRVSRGLLVLTSLAGALACAGNDLAAPPQAIDGPSATANQRSRLPGSRAYLTSASSKRTFLRCVTPEAMGAALIGPSGGELRVGPHRLIVPAGAVPHPTEISGYVPADSTITIWLEPHGMIFRKPVGLQLDASNCESIPDVIYVGDAADGATEYIRAEYSALWKTVAAPLDHFSGYAIAFRDSTCAEPVEPDGPPANCGSGSR